MKLRITPSLFWVLLGSSLVHCASKNIVTQPEGAPALTPVTSTTQSSTLPSEGAATTQASPPPIHEPLRLLSFKGEYFHSLDPHWNQNKLVFLVNNDSLDRDTLRLWDATTKRDVFSVDVQNPQSEEERNDCVSGFNSPSAYRAQLSQDGTKILTSGRDRTRLWDASTGKQILLISHAYKSKNLYGSGIPCNALYVTTAILSPDATKILTAGYHEGTDELKDGPTLWDAATGEKLLSLSKKSVTAGIGFSPDGSQIVTMYPKVKLWDSTTGKELLSLEAGWASFSPDGSKLLIVNNKKSANIFDAKNGKKLLALKESDCTISTAGFTPSGTKILTVGVCKEKNIARLWDAASGKALVTIGDKLNVTTAHYSPDESKIATGNEVDNVTIWDANNGSELFTMDIHAEHEDFVKTVQFSPDGRKILAINSSSQGGVWQLP